MTQRKDEQPYADVPQYADADNLNMIDVANDFFTGNSHRLSNFGHFS